MLFPTTDFAIFLVAVFVLHWALNRYRRPWKWFMLAASYVFYAWWDVHLVWLLALVSAIAHVGAVWIEAARTDRARTRRTITSVAALLLPLGWFKYYGFFALGLANALERVGLHSPLPLLEVVLPVGISFYTFMAISYVVDTYRGDFAPTTLEKFAVYLSFFPHLVAGPIVRPAELIPQIDTPRDPRRVDTSRAFYLIATGLFKKVVISNYLAASIVDEVFGAPGNHSSLEILIAVYAYAVQIYADFSGYTDIAIGIALLLGFRFPQNFDSPYAATSLQDFWRRWHMTLSRWLRDYVYVPLGGNRHGRILTYRNIMLTMLLGGLWHGAAWTFVAWGALHGGGLVLERWRRERRGGVEPARSARRVWAARLVTFHVVCLGWIFFRSDSFRIAWEMITGLFTGWGQPSPLVTGGVLLAIAVGIGSQYLPRRVPELVMARFSQLPVLGQAAVLALALMLTSAMGPEGVQPFIYFQF